MGRGRWCRRWKGDSGSDGCRWVTREFRTGTPGVALPAHSPACDQARSHWAGQQQETAWLLLGHRAPLLSWSWGGKPPVPTVLAVPSCLTFAPESPQVRGGWGLLGLPSGLVGQEDCYKGTSSQGRVDAGPADVAGCLQPPSPARRPPLLLADPGSTPPAMAHRPGRGASPSPRDPPAIRAVVTSPPCGPTGGESWGWKQNVHLCF